MRDGEDDVGVSLVVVDDGRVRLFHELRTAGLPEDHLSRWRAEVEGESRSIARFIIIQR